MTLLFADGFEDGAAAWTIASAAIGTGRFGSGLVLSSGAGSGTVGIAATGGPLIAGCAAKPASAAVMSILTFGRINDEHVQVYKGAAGEVSAYRANTLLGSSATGVMPAGAWSYVECKMTPHATTGIVVVKVNGVQVLNLSNMNTADGSALVGYVAVGGSPNLTSQAAAAFDDFYICDATGTVNNDFLGELTVEHLRPASDDTAQWLGSDANSVNNFALVDEAGAYDGADYVASTTVGQRDLYVPVPSARSSASPVLGVVVAATAMKTDIGARTVKLNVKEGSGGTVRQSAELGLPGSFGELSAVFERKGDGSQFTVADVNALRMGMEVAS